MSRRWPLAVGAVVAVVAVGSLARVDGQPEGADVTDSGPPEPREPEWAPVGAWTPIANSPGGSRRDHTAVWTGPCPGNAPPRSCGELIVWGGRMVVGPRSDGAAYHPATDTWRRIPPAPREPLEWGAVPGVWTGAELVIWGAAAADFAGNPPDAGPRGVAYDPVAHAWRTLPEAPLEPRFGHTLTWTGAEVVVWGGRRAGGKGRAEPLADGAAYDPDTDTWRILPEAPLAGRRDHTAVWLRDAGRLVVWGGVSRREGTWTPMVDGAAYDPAADAWEPIPAPRVAAAQRVSAWEPAATRLDAPERLAAVAPLTDPDTGTPVVAFYDPAAERWELVPAGPVGARGGAHVGGGARLVAWGGAHGDRPSSGAVYWPRTDAWRTVPDDRQPVAGESATWTGAGLLTWGGGREGAVWDPDASGGRRPPGTAPHALGETRQADVPAGHETGWRLQTPAGPTAIDVSGGGAEIDVWLEARSRRGWRIRRLVPAGGGCSAERCVHHFDQLPGQLPGPVEVRLLNRGDEALTVTLTPVHGPSG